MRWTSEYEERLFVSWSPKWGRRTRRVNGYILGPHNTPNRMAMHKCISGGVLVWACVRCPLYTPVAVSMRCLMGKHEPAAGWGGKTQPAGALITVVQQNQTPAATLWFPATILP